jgi:hypothetical protein
VPKACGYKDLKDLREEEQIFYAQLLFMDIGVYLESWE